MAPRERGGIPHLDQYPNIARARALSDDRIRLARQYLDPHRVEGLDVVGFGSLARREMTTESDFDYIVLALGLPRDPPLRPVLEDTGVLGTVSGAWHDSR